MIFVDSNIPMYLVGAEHPNKGAAQRVLDAAVSAGRRLVSDAAVYQEILHRYSAGGHREAIDATFDLLDSILDEVLPIDIETVRDAASIVRSSYRLPPRDAVHVAAMLRADVHQIMSFDTGFDGYPGLTRQH